MYVNIGEDTIIHTREIIAFFDFNGLMTSEVNQPIVKDILEQLDENAASAIKSLVVTTNGLFLSPFSPATLNRRMQSIMATMSC